MPVTVWESDGGEDRRGQERSPSPLGAEIMIYSEEIHSSPVCSAVREKYLRLAEALKKHSATNE